VAFTGERRVDEKLIQRIARTNWKILRSK